VNGAKSAKAATVNAPVKNDRATSVMKLHWPLMIAAFVTTDVKQRQSLMPDNHAKNLAE
jgi:hypothetical protein